MKRSLSFAVRVVGLAAMSILIGSLVPAGRAATLYWTGSVSTNWFDTDGVNTNWRNALNEQVLPTDGDDLVFTSAGIYTGNLTLGGATITLNSITVGDPNDPLHRWSQRLRRQSAHPGERWYDPLLRRRGAERRVPRRLLCLC